MKPDTSDANPTELQEILHNISQQPMNGFQIRTVGLCLIVNLLDGFDVLAISFAAPLIATEWSLSASQIGLLFSAGLTGMVLGSLLLSSIADHIGRRRTILSCLLIVTLAMAASAWAESSTSLALWRFIVGLGVGTILPSINTLVAEFGSEKRRELAITSMQAGFPAGAALGGIAAVFLVDLWGWRGIFWFGALLSAIALVAAYRMLPESLEFLFSRADARRLPQANRLLIKLDQPELAAFPAAVAGQSPNAVGLSAMLSRDLIWRTILLAAAYFFMMASYYFVASWTPKLLVDSGLTLQAGISGGIVLSVGGICGGLLLGGYASRFGTRRLAQSYLLLSIPAMIVFAFVSDLHFMLVSAFVMGFFLVGSIMGLYALTPSLFNVNVRNTATGIIIGFGRFGAILGPALTGVLLDGGASGAVLYQVFALPLIISVIALAVLKAPKPL